MCMGFETPKGFEAPNIGQWRKRMVRFHGIFTVISPWKTENWLEYARIEGNIKGIWWGYWDTKGASSWSSMFFKPVLRFKVHHSYLSILIPLRTSDISPTYWDEPPRNPPSPSSVLHPFHQKVVWYHVNLVEGDQKWQPRIIARRGMMRLSLAYLEEYTLW